MGILPTGVFAQVFGVKTIGTVPVLAVDGQVFSGSRATLSTMPGVMLTQSSNDSLFVVKQKKEHDTNEYFMFFVRRRTYWEKLTELEVIATETVDVLSYTDQTITFGRRNKNTIYFLEEYPLRSGNWEIVVR